MLRTLLITAGFLVVGFGQPTTTRVLPFSTITEPQAVMEASTVIRSTAEIRNAKADPQARTLELQAEAWQLDLAEWILQKLDRTSPTVGERLDVPGIVDPAILIVTPKRADTVASLQELNTLVRSVLEIPRAFIFTPSKIAVLRGTRQQIEAAEWLFRELDLGPSSDGAAHNFSFGPDDVLRVLYLRTELSPEQFLRNVADVRRTVQIQRTFTFGSMRAVAFRGSTEDVAKAEAMLQQRQLLLPVASR